MTHRLSLTELAAAGLVAGLATAGGVALLGAQLAHFNAWAAMVAGLAGLALALLLLLRATGRPSLDLADGAVAVLLLVALWRLWPAAAPWPVFLDPSWYANTAAKIAETGGLRFAVPILAVPPAARAALVTSFRDERDIGLPFPDDERQGFHALAFAVPDTGRPEAVPYHPPLFTSWLAVGYRLGAARGLALGVVLWLVAWLLAVAALARASFGALAAAVAAALLALGPAPLYYGTSPFAEPAAGALALMGTWALVQLAGSVAPRRTWALMAGLALGMAVLVKVDAVLPMLAGCAWWLAARRRAGGRSEALGLVAGLALPGLWFLWLAATVPGLYVRLNGGGVLRLMLGRWPLLLAAAFLVLAVAGVWSWTRRRGQERRAASRRNGGWARAAADPATRRLAFGLTVAAVVGLAWTVGQAVGPNRPPGMVAILAWLLTPLGLFAALVGLVWALVQAGERYGPVLSQALLAAGVVLVAPVVTQSLSALYTGRRLVPMTLPIAAVLAGAALTAWWQWRAVTARSRQRRGWDLAVVAGLLLAGVALVRAGEPLRSWREFAGGETLARRLAQHVGPEDVLLFPSTLHGADPGRMAAATWVLTGRQTAVVGAPGRDPALVAQAVDAWRAAGRDVYYVTDAAHPLEVPLPGYETEDAGEEAIVTTAVAPRPVLPPDTQRLDLQLLLYHLVPADSR